MRAAATHPPRRVLVTGASGFIGCAVVDALVERGIAVRRAVRTLASDDSIDTVLTGAIDAQTDWSQALADVDVVVHLAARTSERDGRGDPWHDFRAVNVHATEALARACVTHRVRRLVFVSSVAVYGVHSAATPITDMTEPWPVSPYGISKLDAEQALIRIAAASGLEIVILRPPMVYGPHGHGNLERLLRLLISGVPLPLGSVNNARSALYVSNCADAILVCASHPRATGRIYLIRDDDDFSMASIAALMRSIPKSQGAPSFSPRLLKFPLWALRAGAAASGRRDDYERITGSLVVDDSTIRDELGWRPPFSAREGLLQTIAWLRADANKNQRQQEIEV
jgi:nucleoside-diphosphate-sugar epimerase